MTQYWIEQLTLPLRCSMKAAATYLRCWPAYTTWTRRERPTPPAKPSTLGS